MFAKLVVLSCLLSFIKGEVLILSIVIRKREEVLSFLFLSLLLNYYSDHFFNVLTRGSRR
ncbi:hypothetical protein T492DRAFT_1005347 [Pavlovales sp. CCMP2436]|nr:hypothetical protein T492DRAFT_1005347 [Pavlovales sp. CCMP2436]